MVTGIIFGFITAVTLGINSLLTAVVVRRFGVLRSVSVTVTLACLVMMAWAALIGVRVEMEADHLLLLVSAIARFHRGGVRRGVPERAFRPRTGSQFPMYLE